jgi:hypothetical protein
MPRHPRVHAEGLLYHLIARGNNGQKIFLRESDYQVFIERLRTVQELTRFGGDLGQVFCWQFRRILSTPCVRVHPCRDSGDTPNSQLRSFPSQTVRLSSGSSQYASSSRSAA